MSLKTLIQIIILIIIFIILGGVYFQYFSKQKIDVDETIKKSQENTFEDLENKGSDKKDKKVKKITKLDDSSSQNITPEKKRLKEITNNDNDIVENKKIDANKITDLVRDVEYLTKDKNGNIYKILASSGKTNKSDTNILDLENVRGEINSEKNSTVYIFSDFAEYNSSNLKSKFYSNVKVNYEDKQILCENLEINMDTNIVIAYNNVVVTDLKSIMKAGKITLDIETKEIFINPEKSKESKVIINSKY